MRVKIPTDPTIPNPQDTKDAPQSPNGGDSGFMPYVSAWERLADAIRRVRAGRRPKELAQIDLCRAIADRTVKIRCKLKRHTRGYTSNAVLEGKDFHIPTEIKPEDLNWETSCPVKPWLVRRGSYSIPGYWDLEWIEVCRADVTKVLCAAKEQDETTRHASSETPATSTSRPALESQEMPVGPGRRSTAGPRKPGAAGPGRRRGARPEKFERTKNAMRNDIQQGQLTVVQLERHARKESCHELRRLARHRSKSPQCRFVGIEFSTNSDKRQIGDNGKGAPQSRALWHPASGSVGPSERG